MKKLIALLMAATMALSLCACGGNEKAPSEEGTVSADAETTTTETSDAPAGGTAEESIGIATITTNESETVEMSAQELMDVFDGNQARFEKLYSGAEITVVGTVKSIAVDTDVLNVDGNVSAGQKKIVFEEGWCLAVGADNSAFDLADYDVGMKLKITSGIVSAFYKGEYLETICDGFRVVWLTGDDEFHGNSQTNIKTSIEIVD